MEGFPQFDPQTEGAEYIQPARWTFLTLRRTNKQELRRKTAKGFRIRVLDGDVAILEPKQEGVTRYPPVKVTQMDNNLKIKRSAKR